MTTDTMALFALYALFRNTRTDAVVPEPEFTPFALPGRAAAARRAAAPAPAGPARKARTLEELGLPAPLARELEASLKALGLTDGDRITGFTFRTVDGASYALRTAAEPARARRGLAA